MSSKRVVTLAVLAVVFTWSTVMTVLGHGVAAAALLPSLGLLVQQIVQALTAPDGSRPPTSPTAAGAQEPPR
ncbi:hypothetical protein ACIGDI_39545 [Streptomyces sp. NPDC085900]|uniref:hypothetical protein n=1 Tax=Streptomyces sp. NPDC085900 TaxID=3365737 RepID=UPI0037CFFF09